MSAIDELLARHKAGLAAPSCCDAEEARVRPRLKTAVLSCMDSRIDLFKVLGLRVGDIHMLRNAGGLVTDDALRSLVLSQQLLGTLEVMIIQHTDCGLQGKKDADLAGRLEALSGEQLPFAFGGFDDLDASVRSGIERVRNCPWLVRRDGVRGFVFDVHDRRLREVV